MREIKVSKILLFLVFSILSDFITYAQQYPDTFKLGDYLEVFSSDSIKVYFDRDARIVQRQCAEYYRVGRLDSINCNVEGLFKDFYMNSSLMFKGTMRDNSLNGLGTYYYPNGQIKEIGLYLNEKRIGLWMYFYPDGKLERSFLFDRDEPRILTFIAETGDTLVYDGNGFFWGPMYKYQFKKPYVVGGPVKNSFMDGEWTLNNPTYQDSLGLIKSKRTGKLILPPVDKVSSEFYSEGNLLKVVDNKNIENGLKVISLQDYVVNEFLNIYNNSFGCGQNKLLPPLYSKDQYFTGFTLFPALSKDIEHTISNSISDQWLIVSLQISEKNKLVKELVFSSINDQNLEKSIGDLLIKKYSSWKSMNQNDKKVASNLFFTILITSNHVIIPVYETHRNYY
jgi:hypothetical protein